MMNPSPKPTPVCVRLHPVIAAQDASELSALLTLLQAQFKFDQFTQETALTADFFQQASLERLASIYKNFEYLWMVMSNSLGSTNTPYRATTASDPHPSLSYCQLKLTLAQQALEGYQPSSAESSGFQHFSQTILQDFTLECLAHLHQYFNEVLEANLDLKQLSHLLDRAEQFRLLSQPRAKTISVLPVPTQNLDGYEEKTYVVLVDTPARVMDEAMATTYFNWVQRKTVPSWTHALSYYEQQMLRHALSGVLSPTDVLERLVNVSSRLRVIPALPNAYVHECYWVNSEGWKLLNRAGRSSMIASRELQGRLPEGDTPIGHQSGRCADEVMTEHAVENLKMTILHQITPKTVRQYFDARQITPEENAACDFPILFQTMISPYLMMRDKVLFAYKAKAVAALTQVFSDGIPIVFERHGKRYPVRVFPKIFSTNHPINYFTWVHGASGHRRKVDTQNLVQFVQEESSWIQSPKQRRAIQQLVREIDVDREANFNFFKKTNQSLMLNTHEQLLMQCLGGQTVGSCESGKDRKAIEIIHTDAAAIYHHVFDQYPGFHRTNSLGEKAKTKQDKRAANQRRQFFHRVFAELFSTRHHQRLASENAPGAAGIRHSDIYLSGRSAYADEIQQLYCRYASSELGGQHALTCEDLLAGRNVITKIVFRKGVTLKNVSGRLGDYMQQAERYQQAKTDAHAVKCLAQAFKVAVDDKIKTYWKPSPIMMRVQRIVAAMPFEVSDTTIFNRTIALFLARVMAEVEALNAVFETLPSDQQHFLSIVTAYCGLIDNQLANDKMTALNQGQQQESFRPSTIRQAYRQHVAFGWHRTKTATKGDAARVPPSDDPTHDKTAKTNAASETTLHWTARSRKPKS